MTHEHYLQAWQESQELAEAMQPLQEEQMRKLQQKIAEMQSDY